MRCGRSVRRCSPLVLLLRRMRPPLLMRRVLAHGSSLPAAAAAGLLPLLRASGCCLGLRAPHADLGVLAARQAQAARRARPQHRAHHVGVAAARQSCLRVPKQGWRLRARLLLLLLHRTSWRLRHWVEANCAAIVACQQPQLVGGRIVLAADEVVQPGGQRLAHWAGRCRCCELLPGILRLAQRTVAACRGVERFGGWGAGTMLLQAVGDMRTCAQLLHMQLAKPSSIPHRSCRSSSSPHSSGQ